MTATAPTQDDFLLRFPEFADTDGDLIDVVLAEAARGVDSTWLDGDYQLGIMLLTAHVLNVDEASGSLATISQSIGPLRETLSVAKESGLDRTSYGERFKRLARQNQPPILVV